jgi:hypothetical protein
VLHRNLLMKAADLPSDIFGQIDHDSSDFTDEGAPAVAPSPPDVPTSSDQTSSSGMECLYTLVDPPPEVPPSAVFTDNHEDPPNDQNEDEPAIPEGLPNDVQLEEYILVDEVVSPLSSSADSDTLEEIEEAEPVASSDSVNNEEMVLTEAASTGPTSASEDNSAMDLTPPVEDPDELASDHNTPPSEVELEDGDGEEIVAEVLSQSANASDEDAENVDDEEIGADVLSEAVNASEEEAEDVEGEEIVVEELGEDGDENFFIPTLSSTRSATEYDADGDSGDEIAPVDPLGEDEVSSAATVTAESVDSDSESGFCRPAQERPRRARQRRQVLTYDRLGEPRIMRYPSLFCLEAVLTTKPAQPRRRRTRRERDASRLERMKQFSAGSNSETK